MSARLITQAESKTRKADYVKGERASPAPKESPPAEEVTAQSLQKIIAEIESISESVEALAQGISDRPEPINPADHFVGINKKVEALRLLMADQQKQILKIAKQLADSKTDWEFIPERHPRGYVIRWIAKRI